MILIRAKTDEPDSEGRVPKISEIFSTKWSYLKDDSPILMPPEVVGKLCNHCNGDKYQRLRCDMCNGSGRHKCECETKHECGYCEGIGRIRTENQCPECKGSGVGRANLEIGEIRFGSSLIITIVENVPNPRMIATSDHKGLFEFDGGDGVVMALK